MLPIVAIIVALTMVGLGLWIAQAYRSLDYAGGLARAAWEELRGALGARREMVPYIVAAVPTIGGAIVDVIGNACDLATHVNGIRECAQAEARLASAIAKLFSQVDIEADLDLRAALGPLRDRLDEQEMRIGVLKRLYNRQVEAHNLLLRQGGGRILASLGIVGLKDEF